MTHETEIPLGEYLPGDTLWLKQGPHVILNKRNRRHPNQMIEVGGPGLSSAWINLRIVDRITRPISEADALRAEVEQLRAQLATLQESYRIVRAQAVNAPAVPKISPDAERLPLQWAEMPVTRHYSDCATNNAPALDPGPCDCGGVPTIPEGFTPHKGGPCPLDHEALVEIVCRNVPIGTPGFSPCYAKEVAATGGVIGFKLIAPPHNLKGFGPIKAGPPPVDAEAETFAVFRCGKWSVHSRHTGRVWDTLATAHAMREG